MKPPLRLERGAVFAGDFKVVRPLRTGGQGSLYVVEQISTSKHRALKLMLPELVAQPAARRRFELEARVAARIQSDHVVESIGSGVDAKTGVPWLAMELLEGEDLAARLQQRKRLPPGEVLEVFDQLCHALGEAHKQGIVHRDLKPENIFLATPRRRGVSFMVKVLDFGIARVVAEAQTMSGQTSTGLGTPMWMAPEQTMPGGPVAPCTDVWPLGLLAFRMLTGYLFWKTPYETGGSVMMLMAEAFMHPMPTASDRAAHYKCQDRIPAGFDAWFAKCLSRPMDGRYANASETFAALEPVLAPFAEPAPASRLSSAEPVAILERASTGPRERTGPGLATWGGAPELSDSAMISDVDAAKPVTGAGPRAPTPAPSPVITMPGVAPPPPAASPTPDRAPPVPRPAAPSAPEPVPRAAAASTPEPAPRPAAPSTPEPAPVSGPRASGPGLGGVTGEQVPPVTKAAPTPTSIPHPPEPAAARASLPPVPKSKAPMVIGAAVAAGVLLGVVIFALRGKDAPPAPGAPPASVQAAAPPATPSPPPPLPPPAETATASAAPSASAAEEAPSASASAGEGASSPGSPGRKPGRLCKPAGAKCFGNDDCCDRTCRKWTCRANADLSDPYGGEKKPVVAPKDL